MGHILFPTADYTMVRVCWGVGVGGGADREVETPGQVDGWGIVPLEHLAPEVLVDGRGGLGALQRIHQQHVAESVQVSSGDVLHATLVHPCQTPSSRRHQHQQLFNNDVNEDNNNNNNDMMVADSGRRRLWNSWWRAAAQLPLAVDSDSRCQTVCTVDRRWLGTRMVWALLAAPASSSLLCSFMLVCLDPRSCDWRFSLRSAIGVRPPFVSTDSRVPPVQAVSSSGV